MKNIQRKHDLDARVALEMGLTQKQVRHVTSAFLAKVKEALSNFEEVHLDSFGVFRLVEEKARTEPILLKAPKGKTQKVHIQRKLRVHFSKSATFKRMLQDRYGPNGYTEKKP